MPNPKLCEVCRRPDCEPAAHEVWTEFDPATQLWVEKGAEDFFEQSMSQLTKLLAKAAVCGECEGSNLTEDRTRCWDCDPVDVE